MRCWPWAFLLPLVVQAQSGSDPSVDCTSHISMTRQEENTLTCELDPDDAEEVENITLCPTIRRTCERRELEGNIIIFKSLDTLKKYELHIQFVTGESFREVYELKSIIKPNAPWIINATFSEKSGTLSIDIGTQYHQDYLKGKLEFELDITSAQITALKTQVLYSHVIIDESHLRFNTNYSVRVRARPNGRYFGGTWSEWGPSVSFQTPTLQEPDASLLVYTLIPAVVLILLLMPIVRWHNVIKSFIWPSIPNPKNTLLQMYKPNKALPISFNPEAFRDRIIHLVNHVEAKGVDQDIPGGGSGSCEVKGREWEGLGMWNPGSDLEWMCILPKPRAGEPDGGGGTQTTGLLDGPGAIRGGSWPKTPAVPPTGRREQPYITISGFFNTQ
ncbi:hypothetical protein SKAU_G00358620 [Synaphobranchus kaupii]|uniref:Interleukin-7 receptor subunit alpha n=1 Tax=Synaphobranchus kaupii TaxID=118154 RepID=A0A9Q1IGW2_SYNKA|nr:hypothetical protein SKAU_G00358620 [Synaphobranchus kaupii]